MKEWLINDFSYLVWIFCLKLDHYLWIDKKKKKKTITPLQARLTWSRTQRVRRLPPWRRSPFIPHSSRSISSSGCAFLAPEWYTQTTANCSILRGARYSNRCCLSARTNHRHSRFYGGGRYERAIERSAEQRGNASRSVPVADRDCLATNLSRWLGHRLLKENRDLPRLAESNKITPDYFLPPRGHI